MGPDEALTQYGRAGVVPMVFLTIWLISLDIASIWVAVQVARGKNRDPLAWGVLAAIWGVFAVLFITVVPALPAGAVAARERAARPYQGQRSGDGAVL